MIAQLNGRHIKIFINDFVGHDLTGHLTISSDVNTKILIVLDAPLIVGNITYTHAVATPRLAKDSLLDLANGRAIGCSVTWVPESKFDASRAFDLSWWRGGAVAITDVCLI